MTSEELTAAGAAELRATVHNFLCAQHSEDDLARAVEHLRAARDLLDGPRAPAYYERMDDQAGDRQKAFEAYLNQTAFGGGNNPVGPPGTLELDPDPERPGVIGKVVAGGVYEDPAKCLHGGYVAGLFDHFLGMSQHAYSVARNLPLMAAATRELTITYHAPTPLDTELVFRAWCEDVDDRTLRGHGTCHAGDVLTATAEGTFVKLGAARMLSKDPEGFKARP